MLCIIFNGLIFICLYEYSFIISHPIISIFELSANSIMVLNIGSDEYIQSTILEISKLW